MTPERPHEPSIGPTGKLIIVAFGLWAAFGWLAT
jgi:hypothetical protein